jgi:hypothetical protein
MKFEFSKEFTEIAQISRFIKIRPVGTELFHAERSTDGWTDMTNLIVAFRNFPNAPENA